MVATGNLPDMGFFTPTGSGDITQLIKGGHILDMTPYLDKIPNYAEKQKASLQYVKDYQSNGTGKVYCVITQIGPYDSYPIDVGCYSTAVRWDIYEKAGKPEVTDMYSFLNALAKMKEVYPKTEEGLPTFGICLFNDWDSTEMSCWKKYGSVTGVMETNFGYNVYDLVNDKFYPMLEKGSPYYEGLKWLNTANRMGLIDPDSPTQNFTISNAKVAESGQSLSSTWGSYYSSYNTAEHVNADIPTGYMPLIWKGQHPVTMGETKIGKISTPISVSSTISDEKVDACLKFINLMFDEDACMTMYSGLQGDAWDIEDGKYIITESAKKNLETGGKLVVSSTGETCSNFWASWGLAGAYPHSKLGVELNTTSTVAYNQLKMKGNKIIDMWGKHYNKERPIEVWKELDALCPTPEWNNLIETLPDDLVDVQNNVKSVVTTQSWQMVMNAQSDEEFDALFDKMAQEAESLGLQQLVDWGQAQIIKAKTAADNYK